MIKTLGRALPLILVATGLSLGAATAQNLLPWPTGPGGAGAAPMMAAPEQQQSGPGQDVQQRCLAQFTALRTSVEKLGAFARAGGEHKVSREEMCKRVQAFAAAEAKWVKFTVDNTTRCGIPPQVPKQLREAHSHTLTARRNICSGGPGPGGPPAPTLSDALGTSHLPLPDGSRSGRGTLDTLTGNAIAR